jgi:hypothetical protein
MYIYIDYLLDLLLERSASLVVAVDLENDF